MQRIYVLDQDFIKTVKTPSRYNIRFGVYGMQVNQEAFISILNQGSSMSAIRSRLASVDQPYNQTFYRFYLRESQSFQFASISSSVSIIEWTPWSTLSDFEMEYQFIKAESKDYAGMAKRYQAHLIDQGILTSIDETTSLGLDLSLIGGYINQENFLGIPYQAVRALTNTEEASLIVEELLSAGINHLHVLYQGFANEGLKNHRFDQIRFQRAIGTANDFKRLNETLQSKQVSLYPEISLAYAYSSKHLKVDEDVVRDVFYKPVKNYGLNPATFTIDPTTRERYTLHPATYQAMMTSVLTQLSKLGIHRVAISDLGQALTGSYLKKDTLFRSDTENIISSVYEETRKTHELMLRNPNQFQYFAVNRVTDLAIQSTPYQIISTSVPFVPLVLSGRVDYSYQAINLNDSFSLDWQALKHLETGANLAIAWSYHSTISLVGSEYSTYFSTYYEHWFDTVTSMYQRLNQTGVYASRLVYHEFLNQDRSVSKSWYQNGLQLVFNYSSLPYSYQGLTIPSMQYAVVQEANS